MKTQRSSTLLCSLAALAVASGLARASQQQQQYAGYLEAGETAPCVLSIRPLNSSTSYLASAGSYLTNYVANGQRDGAYGAPVYAAGAGPAKQSICITQRDVDLAVEEARASLGGYVPNEIYTANSELPKPMQVSVVAEIITQATRILANRFKLSEPAILYELPSVDLAKSSAIDKICPLFLKPTVNCEHSKYRTISGFCNNLQYQSWGSTRSAMVRFLAPDYYDSISLPRRAYDGSPLPSARVVSFVVHQDPPEYDKFHSMLSVVWGQFIDHDMTLAVQATDENPSSGPERLDCCKSEDAHPDCFPIEIPKGDPFYGYFNQKCMHFTRASAGLQPGCSLGPVQAMNKISSYMDGNLIYGIGIKSAQRLRTYQLGQMRTQPVSSARAYGSAAAAGYLSAGGAGHSPAGADYGEAALADAAAAGLLSADAPGAEYLVAAGSSQHQARRRMLGVPAQADYARPESAGAYKELLPALTHAPETGCERRGRAKDVYCFEAADPRANEQIQLTTMHTLMVREHNRLAKELSYINPYWDDERLYQEARQIVIAQLQHITFNEFLPLVIGKDKIYEYGLELEHPGRYYQGYDSKINAGIRVEFQAAAFRYGHSILPSYIERYNKFHQKIESIRLSKLLKQPYDLYHPGVLDTYLLGLVNQRSGRMDPTLTTEVTNHLFEKPGKFFGIDLAAINIQRGRDMGVPGYNHFREYCGLPRAKYFDDLTGVFSNKTLLRLSQLYKHVDDIDLWTAGIAEYPMPDGLVGPTFACMIARQFVNLRRGDRFWYENAGYPAQFTIDQLDEIRKSTAARLVCDNSDDIETIQASAMLVADSYTNPRVPCASLPSIDLAKWKELDVSYPAPARSPLYQAPPAAAAELAHNDVYGVLPPPTVPSLDDDEAYNLNKLAHEAAATYSPKHLAPAEASEYEPFKMNSHHFVNHLVDVSNYRPEMSSYSSSKAASKAAAAAAASA